MTMTLGILVLLEANPGKGDDLAAFLKAGRDLAVAEEGTVTWYAFKIDDTSYGIFDTFATDDARTAHINGPIPAALAKCRPICSPANRASGPSTSWRSSSRGGEHIRARIPVPPPGSWRRHRGSCVPYPLMLTSRLTTGQ
jgi:hypothetical protein